MATKEKKNGKTLEELRLNDQTNKTFAIRTNDQTNTEKVLGIVIAASSKTGGRSLGNGSALTLASRDAVLALRRHNKTHKDKVHYEVL
ncbi:MAG: hypothetical protein KGI06_03115 [Candidatus Micrarchaeota archaeon]|nr:hypothetical protein [Candidatus Micrarchaeota archaeon]